MWKELTAIFPFHLAELRASYLSPFRWQRRKRLFTPQLNRKCYSNVFTPKWAIAAPVSFIGTASAELTKIMQTVCDIHSFIASELTNKTSKLNPQYVHFTNAQKSNHLIINQGLAHVGGWVSNYNQFQ